MNPNAKCHWWNRWRHRRLRLTDRRFMIPLLVGAPGLTNKQRAAAVSLFLWDRGQEHWHCACSGNETAEVLASTYFPEGTEP